MREILFKAKHEDTGKWIYGDLIHEPFGACIQYLENGRRIKSKIDENTISQYTGLTDKNSNKIFENDIITIPREDERFVIRWDIEQAAFVIASDTLCCDFDNYWDNELEVVGNVFDNADLLKESEK